MHCTALHCSTLCSPTWDHLMMFSVEVPAGVWEVYTCIAKGAYRGGGGHHDRERERGKGGVARAKPTAMILTALLGDVIPHSVAIHLSHHTTITLLHHHTITSCAK